MQYLRQAFVAGVIAALCSCNGGQGKREIPSLLEVSVPNEVFALRDEVIAFKAMRRRGDTMKDVRISLDALYKKVGKFEDVYLLRYTPIKVEPVEFKKGDRELIADLKGGDIYLVVAKPSGRLWDTYQVLCNLDHLRVRRSWKIRDPICLRILCSPELFQAEKLYDEFPELREFRDELGFEDLTLGGLGEFPPPPGGRTICDRCIDYRRPGHIFPIEGCWEIPPPPPLSATLINITPRERSNESNQDSEPFLAIDQIDSRRMAATAFTPSPSGGDLAPIYISEDHGQTWRLNEIVPSSGSFGTGDITVAPGDMDRELYAGILKTPGYLLGRYLRTPDFTAATQMTVLQERDDIDQPFIQTTAFAGDDRIYVGYNDLAPGGTGQTATVDVSLDSGATFNPIVIESRGTGNAGQDGPSIRTAIAGDGTVYAAFFGYRTATFVGPGAFDITSDVVVVRDDNGATGANAFRDLIDFSDGEFGRLVVQGVLIPFRNRNELGQERIGSTLSLAVQRTNSEIVYIAWCDRISTDDYTMHVRRSTDRGVTWSDDLRTISNATCAALAIMDNGTVGLLYQQVVPVNGSDRWQTNVEITRDAFSSKKTVRLADVPAGVPTASFLPYIGDYNYMTAIGNEFRGIFSANNTPNRANFPNGVTYQRIADFDITTLFDDAGNAVNISIDPFYFSIIVPRNWLGD
ncbi:MAG: hypothetical protein IH983_00290 [Planctomycetes bacterium]|nr:hypothetical protein [Planctomycetota bacterium]